MRTVFALTVFSAIAAAIVACGRPDNQTAETTPPLATPEQTPALAPLQASSTGVFVNEIVAATHIEVEISRIAVQRAEHRSVRQFAQTLIADGESTQSEVERLSQEAGVALASTDDAAAAAVDRVRQADAVTLDARYLDLLISTRQRAIDEFERYAQGGENADLRAWAQERLPALRARLQEADTLRQSVNVAPS